MSYFLARFGTFDGRDVCSCSGCCKLTQKQVLNRRVSLKLSTANNLTSDPTEQKPANMNIMSH